MKVATRSRHEALNHVLHPVSPHSICATMSEYRSDMPPGLLDLASLY